MSSTASSAAPGAILISNIAIGAAAAAGFSRPMRTLLFEVQPLDPVEFAGASAIWYW
jgi:hypothetical protein